MTLFIKVFVIEDSCKGNEVVTVFIRFDIDMNIICFLLKCLRNFPQNNFLKIFITYRECISSPSV